LPEELLRALTISNHGGLDQLELRDDIPVPDLRGPHDVRVKLSAAALNHLDLFVVEGLPGVNIRPPWIMGADGTGTVESTGDAVTSVKVGDSVIINPGISDRTCEYCLAGDHSLCLKYGLLGEHHPGTLTEFIVLPEYNVRPVAASIPVQAAAAFTLVTLTAWHMLVERARLRAGEDVLIQGIGGGVALAALGVARLVGARTWVTSTSAAKLEKAAALGADVVLDSNSVDVGRVIREKTNKRGVDVVVDSVGEATWRSSMAALGKRGRLVTCGGTSGPVVRSDLRRVFWHHQSILGSTMGSETDFDTITAHFNHGKLPPVIDSVFELKDGKAAFARLASREQMGKVVVTI
jgi:NADPH:quinone reductase-like Zn-dependent oxidoreductase